MMKIVFKGLFWKGDLLKVLVVWKEMEEAEEGRDPNKTFKWRNTHLSSLSGIYFSKLYWLSSNENV